MSTPSFVLGQRAVRETLRTPDSLVPTLFIPLFFLVVNVGQAARIFPGDDTEFLFGQSYAAFQLPVSLLLAASFGSAALYLVEEIEGGYFDKLRATPISRMSIVMGRLYAEFAKTMVLSAAMIVIAFLFDVHMASGVAGFLVLVLMISLWAVVFSGFLQIIAMKTVECRRHTSRKPHLLSTAVPHAKLRAPTVTDETDGDRRVRSTRSPTSWRPRRALILEGFEWGEIARGYLVVGLAMALMLTLSVRVVSRYD